MCAPCPPPSLITPSVFSSRWASKVTFEIHRWYKAPVQRCFLTFSTQYNWSLLLREKMENAQCIHFPCNYNERLSVLCPSRRGYVCESQHPLFLAPCRGPADEIFCACHYQPLLQLGVPCGPIIKDQVSRLSRIGVDLRPAGMRRCRGDRILSHDIQHPPM